MTKIGHYSVIKWSNENIILEICLSHSPLLIGIKLDSVGALESNIESIKGEKTAVFEWNRKFLGQVLISGFYYLDFYYIRSVKFTTIMS